MFESQTNFLQNLEIKVHMESKISRGVLHNITILNNGQYYSRHCLIQNTLHNYIHYAVKFKFNYMSHRERVVKIWPQKCHKKTNIGLKYFGK